LSGKTALVFGYESKSNASEKTKYHLRNIAHSTTKATLKKSMMGKTSTK